MANALRSEGPVATAVAVPEPIVDLPDLDEALSDEFADRLGVSQVMADVLVSRGFASVNEAAAFLSSDAEASPPALGDLDTAARMLATLSASGARILVHGDYDCDGVCSTALLTRALRTFGAEVVARVPERSDGYGLSSRAIEAAVQLEATCLIAVDCGITSSDEISIAREQGLDVIVVDHHRPSPDGRLPDAVIVHPTLSDPSATPMCATAVAAELTRAIAERLGVDTPCVGLPELSALATVTDVMPLLGINRAIVRTGLAQLPFTRVTGLAALADLAGIDRSHPTVRDLGWSLGPRINAAGRVRAAGAALELLLCDDPERAVELASELDAANAERKLIQRRVMIEAEAQIALAPGASAWTVSGSDWHPGVVGIVAGSLARRFHRPVVAISLNGSTGVGSVRSVPGFDIASALEQCGDLLARFGGHSAAAGLTIESDKVEEFAQRLNSVVESSLPLHLRRPRADSNRSGRETRR